METIHYINLKQNGPVYIWNGSLLGFRVLVENIQHLEICEDKNEFRMLFESNFGLTNVVLNADRAPYVLQFFACLKESGLVSVSGTRGFYHVLEIRVKDFDLVYLKNRTPQRRIDTVKSLVNWPQNQSRFNKLLKDCICH